MVWISNGIWNPEAQPFENRPRHFVFTIWNPVFCPDLEWSCFQMAKSRPFENQTIWKPTFKKVGFQIIPDFEWSPLYDI